MPSPQPNPRDADPSGEELLAETPAQDYVGGRDLTEWRTPAGRAAVGLAVRATRWASPHGLLLGTLVVAGLLFAVFTALAAEVYDDVADADGVSSLDQPALDLAIAARSPTLTAVVQAYTHLGGTVGLSILVTVTTVLMAVAWRQWTPIVLVSAVAVGSVTITVVGKLAVGRARPPMAEAVPPFEQSFSFPSGHSLNSAALAGIVAYLLVRQQSRASARATTVVAAALFAVLMGLSRVYLGVHWLTDVLVAWSLGLAWLTVVITAHRLFLTVRRQRPHRPSPATADRRP